MNQTESLQNDVCRDSKVTFFRELFPQAYYEIAVIFIDVNPLESEKWLQRASECKNYITQELMKVKISYAYKYIEDNLSAAY